MSLLKMWLNEHICYMANILWNNVIYNQMRKTSSVSFLATCSKTFLLKVLLRINRNTTYIEERAQKLN